MAELNAVDLLSSDDDLSSILSTLTFTALITGLAGKIIKIKITFTPKFIFISTSNI